MSPPQTSELIAVSASCSLVLTTVLTNPLSGTKSHWPSENWEAGWGLLFSTGGGHAGAHRRQLAAGSDYTVQRDASSWVHCTLPPGGFPSDCTDWELIVVPVARSGVGHQAVRSCREEGAPEWGVPLPPLHGLRSCRGVQEDAAGLKRHSGAAARWSTYMPMTLYDWSDDR